MSNKGINLFINELKNFDPNRGYIYQYYGRMEALGDQFFENETIDAIDTNDLERFNILNLYNIHFTEELYNDEILERIINKERNEFMIALVESNDNYVEAFYNILTELDWERNYILEALDCLFNDERICDISQFKPCFDRYVDVIHEHNCFRAREHIKCSINEIYKLIIDAFIEKSITEAEFLTGIKAIVNFNDTITFDTCGAELDFKSKYRNIILELKIFKRSIVKFIYKTYIDGTLDTDDLVKRIKSFIECTKILLNNKA